MQVSIYQLTDDNCSYKSVQRVHERLGLKRTIQQVAPFETQRFTKFSGTCSNNHKPEESLCTLYARSVQLILIKYSLRAPFRPPNTITNRFDIPAHFDPSTVNYLTPWTITSKLPWRFFYPTLSPNPSRFRQLECQATINDNSLMHSSAEEPESSSILVGKFSCQLLMSKSS